MKLFLALIFSIFTFSASAEANIFLQNCHQYSGDRGVSISYQMCVNSNFRAIDRELDTFLLSCSNYGDRVSYGFTSCMASNFRHATRELQIFPQYCSNYGDELSLSYQMCVNTNFTLIERKLNSRR